MRNFIFFICSLGAFLLLSPSRVWAQGIEQELDKLLTGSKGVSVSLHLGSTDSSYRLDTYMNPDGRFEERIWSHDVALNRRVIRTLVDQLKSTPSGGTAIIVVDSPVDTGIGQLISHMLGAAPSWLSTSAEEQNL